MITKDHVIQYLHGLPEQREFCSDMGIEALQLAIHNYQNRISPVPETAPSIPVLDCRGLACPLNYVKTKILLEQMKPGQQLCVLLGEEGARNVPVSASEEGHNVVEVVPEDGHWRVTILRRK